MLPYSKFSRCKLYQKLAHGIMLPRPGRTSQSICNDWCVLLSKATWIVSGQLRSFPTAWMWGCLHLQSRLSHSTFGSLPTIRASFFWMGLNVTFPSESKTAGTFIKHCRWVLRSALRSDCKSFHVPKGLNPQQWRLRVPPLEFVTLKKNYKAAQTVTTDASFQLRISTTQKSYR